MCIYVNDVYDTLSTGSEIYYYWMFLLSIASFPCAKETHIKMTAKIFSIPPVLQCDLATSTLRGRIYFSISLDLGETGDSFAQ